MAKVHFTLPPLGYTYDALEPAYAHELLELHHADHHRAYVEGTNRALEDLADMRASGDFRHINQLQKDLTFNLSGHVLHSILWRNLEPNDGELPTGRLETGIRAAFGSFDRFRHQFSAAGAALQGAGWVALAWESTRVRSWSNRSMITRAISARRDAALARDGHVGTRVLPALQQPEGTVDRQLWDLINWGDVAHRLEGASAPIRPRPARQARRSPASSRRSGATAAIPHSPTRRRYILRLRGMAQRLNIHRIVITHRG